MSLGFDTKYVCVVLIKIRSDTEHRHMAGVVEWLIQQIIGFPG